MATFVLYTVPFAEAGYGKRLLRCYAPPGTMYNCSCAEYLTCRGGQRHTWIQLIPHCPDWARACAPRARPAG
jgi:hypothetical protein